MAETATSARTTMPGPPPEGVSSPVRWRPTPWTRMSRTSRSQSRSCKALSISEAASGPGNNSGNSVRTVARHMLLLVLGVARRLDDDAAGSDIYDRHIGISEGNEFRAAVAEFDFDDIARAEIVNGATRADVLAGHIFRTQADQVGVVKFARCRRRQGRSRHVNAFASKVFGGAAIRNTRKVHDPLPALDRTKPVDRKPPAVTGHERAVGADRLRVLGEAFHLHLALHPMRANNHAEKDALLR